MVLIGELNTGDTVEVDGSLWKVEELTAGRSKGYMSVKLTQPDDMTFCTGGFVWQGLKELALTADGARFVARAGDDAAREEAEAEMEHRNRERERREAEKAQNPWG